MDEEESLAFGEMNAADGADPFSSWQFINTILKSLHEEVNILAEAIRNSVERANLLQKNRGRTASCSCTAMLHKKEIFIILQQLLKSFNRCCFC